jgi:hypothetical protein
VAFADSQQMHGGWTISVNRLPPRLNRLRFCAAGRHQMKV